MNTLLVAFALAIAGMNGESNSTPNNASVAPANHFVILADNDCRIDLTNCVDDPGFTKRQLEMRSMEFAPRSFSDRTMIG